MPAISGATTHGTASWLEWPGELTAPPAEAYALPYPVVTVGRTDDNRLALYAPDRHLITFAPTRAGKGTSLVIPTLLLWSGSCLVLDPKGENAWRTAETRRAMGQTVHVLDPFNGVGRYSGGTPEATVKFNPLAGLTLDAIEDIRNVAEALIITGTSRDAHWDNSALDLVEGYVLFEVELALRENRVPSLVRVRQAIADPALGGNWARAAAGNPDAPEDDVMHAPYAAVGKLARFTVEKPSDEILSIFSTAITQTSFLDNPKIQESLDGDGLRLADLAKGQTTIYLVLPSELLDTYGRWMRLILSRAIADVVRINPKTPVLFMLDEFGTVGRLSMVARALGLMAGEGIRIWAFLQDLSQLRAQYKEWPTFIANSGVLQFFSTGDYDTAQYISNYIGAETITTRADPGDFPITPLGVARQLRQEGTITREEFYTYLISFTSMAYRVIAVFAFWYAKPASSRVISPLGLVMQLLPAFIGAVLIAYMLAFAGRFFGVRVVDFSDALSQVIGTAIVLLLLIPPIILAVAVVTGLIVLLREPKKSLRYVARRWWIRITLIRSWLDSDDPAAARTKKMARNKVVIGALILLVLPIVGLFLLILGKFVFGMIALLVPLVLVTVFLIICGLIGIFILEFVPSSIGFFIAMREHENEVRRAGLDGYRFWHEVSDPKFKEIARIPGNYAPGIAIKIGLRVRGRAQANRTALMNQGAQLAQPTRRPLLMPDEAIRLPRDVIVSLLNGRPSRLRQAPYFQQKEYTHLYRLRPGENYPK